MTNQPDKKCGTKKMFHVFAHKPDPKDPTRTLDIPVGVAFTSDRSPTFRIRLDAIPLHWLSGQANGHASGAMVIYLDDPVSTQEVS